jgi:hypothetical protein
MKFSIQLFILVLGWSGSLLSQDPLRIFGDTVNEKPVLQITSFNHYGSGRFNNAFMDKFLFGGHIDQQLKDNNFNRLKGLNNFGGEFEQRIDSYTPNINPFKKEKYGLMLSFSDNHLISANISKDFFGLAVYGNSNYVGDTMDLSYSHAKYQHYQKFSIGFYDKTTLSSVQISYVSGSKAFDFYAANSFLWTHSALDSIELQLQGEGFSTGAFSPYFAFQGSGFSLDINYNFIFNSKKGDKQIISLKLNNLGGIFWNKNTSNYFVDSTTYYTGFNVQDFIGKDSINNQWNFKDTLGLQTTKNRHGEALPLEITLDKLANRYGNKVQAIFGFKAIITPEYRPYLYAGVYYQPVSKFSASTYLSYGGFAGIRMGLYLNYWPSDKIYISLGTADMIGNVSKNFGFGRSAVFSASFKL